MSTVAITLASPQQSAMSALLPWSPHVFTQPSCHKVLVSVNPKESKETSGSAYFPSHLMYAACSACSAIIVREGVSMSELALDENKGLELPWWAVLKSQAE